MGAIHREITASSASAEMRNPVARLTVAAMTVIQWSSSVPTSVVGKVGFDRFSLFDATGPAFGSRPFCRHRATSQPKPPKAR